MQKRILITGGSGTLGKELKRVFPHAYFPTHLEMDLQNSHQVDSVITSYQPDVLIHAAGVVDVRACETDKQLSWDTHVEGTQRIINALRNLSTDCYYVHISTVCVFAGLSGEEYFEDSVPNPKNYHSFTKVGGELISRQWKNSVIIRSNFVGREKWKYPKAFVDRQSTYLFAEHVASGIKDVIDDDKKGIIHITGNKTMSMYDLAKKTGSDVGTLTLDEYDGPPVTVNMNLRSKRWRTYDIDQ